MRAAGASNAELCFALNSLLQAFTGGRGHRFKCWVAGSSTFMLIFFVMLRDQQMTSTQLLPQVCNIKHLKLTKVLGWETAGCPLQQQRDFCCHLVLHLGEGVGCGGAFLRRTAPRISHPCSERSRWQLPQRSSARL